MYVFRVLGPLLGIERLFIESEGNVANSVWAGVMGAGKGTRGLFSTVGFHTCPSPN